jgi:hypothetical protein
MTYRVFTGILPPCCSPGASATSCACVWLCGSLAQTCKLKGNFKKSCACVWLCVSRRPVIKKPLEQLKQLKKNSCALVWLCVPLTKTCWRAHREVSP